MSSTAPARNRPQWIEAGIDADDEPGFAQAVRDGLTAKSKSLPSHFFYDEEGSRLFEAICDLPEYYLTRAEAEILAAKAGELARALPHIETLVELGSGSATKTEHLLRSLGDTRDACRYVPIDVSRSALEESVDRLVKRFPHIDVLPAVGEYEHALAEIGRIELGPKLTIWLGSSIGNLDRQRAAAFLTELRREMSTEDRLLVGIDLKKDPRTLELAYNDAAGVTAQFDLNLLSRMNHELAADFDLTRFEHVARYDEELGAVRSYLVSQASQCIRIGKLDLEIDFAEGEAIHTEDSFKYSETDIADLADAAGLRFVQQFLDDQQRFSLNLFALA